MALVHETGVGLSNADSYVSRSAADAYFVKRNSPSIWTSLTAADDGGRDAALRYATRFLDNRYRWHGSLVSLSQALGWPRLGVLDKDRRDLSVWATVYALYLLPATCEAAAYHAQAAVNQQLLRGGLISSVSVGGGAVAVDFSDYAPPGSTYPFLDDMMLENLGSLTVGGASIREYV